jgi:tRNA dimethylallyltransferase
MSKPSVVVVLGPTASGKSSLAVELARRWNGEVISADSRQVYRGLNIGSGKITHREMRGVRHHLLDVAAPRRVFTVADYQRLARRAIADILKRGKLPIICGGTGLYIDAAIYNTTFPEVKPQTALRKRLEKKTAEALFAELKKKDPRRARSIDRHNKRRLVRALEIIYATGKPVPRSGSARSPYNVVIIGLQVPAELLRMRIKKRLQGWFRQGLIPEVQKLRGQAVSWKKIEEFGLEYKAVAQYLQKKIDKKTMLEQSEKEIVQYAKRQMTWFKRNKKIYWIATPSEGIRVVQKQLT